MSVEFWFHFVIKVNFYFSKIIFDTGRVYNIKLTCGQHFIRSQNSSLRAKYETIPSSVPTVPYSEQIGIC